MWEDDGPEWGYCQQCSEPAMPCYKRGNAGPNEPDALLCHTHAIALGYCGMCADEDDLNESGLCAGCAQEVAEARAGWAGPPDLPF